MATKNDVTGDTIQSKGPSKAYEDNWEKIFGKRCPECGMRGGQHKMSCDTGSKERYTNGEED